MDAASGLLEKAVEKRASLALLGDADKKVREHGFSTASARPDMGLIVPTAPI